jgi:hypothetical protein
MIGKSLNARFGNLASLPEEVASARLSELLATPERAEDIIRIRARNDGAVAVVVLAADEGAVRACRALGLAMKPGGTAIFGLLGADAARLFPALTDLQRAWLRATCGPRETKVMLLAGGLALLSLFAEGGKVRVAARGAT